MRSLLLGALLLGAAAVFPAGAQDFGALDPRRAKRQPEPAPARAPPPTRQSGGHRNPAVPDRGAQATPQATGRPYRSGDTLLPGRPQDKQFACDDPPLVRFQPNSTKILHDANLRELDDQLHRCAADEITITLYANAPGFNLAYARAATLQQYLVAKGVPARLFKVREERGLAITVANGFPDTSGDWVGIYFYTRPLTQQELNDLLRLPRPK